MAQFKGSGRAGGEIVAVADDHGRADEHGEAEEEKREARGRRRPFHSRSARPQSVLKMMMLAMCSVQLENLYAPIWLSPIV